MSYYDKMYDVRLTADKRELSDTERFYAIRFIRDRLGLALAEAVAQFKELQAGGSINFLDHRHLDVPVPFTVTQRELPSEFEQAREKQKALYELLKRGAAGDVEAAIAYCKAELNHEVSHGAMG